MTKKLRLMMTMLLLAVMGSVWGQTGTVLFGNNGIKINKATVTGVDDLGNTWTVTTEGTTSFTPNSSWSQVGSSSSPATSITFTTTLPSSATITSMEAKFGGYSNTAGDITLKVGDTTVGTGSLNGTNDVTVSSSSSASGTVLTVTITNIARGVKCYYISYTLDGVAKPSFSVLSGTYNPPLNVELSCATTDATIYYTEDGTDPTVNSTPYNGNPIVISSLGEKTIKAIAYKNDKFSEVATATYTIVKKVPQLSYTPNSYTVNLYKGFDSPELSNPNSLSPITYSSSDESVAKVNADGSVALFGEGTTTITASFAGNDEYDAGTASYTLTVVKISESKVYKKVTSKDDLVAGKSYVIVYENETNPKAMGAISSTTTPYGISENVSFVENERVSISADVSELILGGSEDAYTFQNSDSKYLSWTSGNSLKVATTVSDNSKWIIVSSGNGYIVKNVYDNTRIVQYNIGNPRFACYTTTQGAAVLYVQVPGVEYEEVVFETDGYKTYVTKNPIDWEATLERNNSNIDVHGYKAIAFSEADGVSLVEFGVENLESVAETDPMYQEPITPAETPMIIMGKQGVNCLVISSVTTANAPKGNLFRKGDGVATTTLKEDGEINVALYVMQKIDVNGSGIDNYKFYRLRPGRTVPEGKAYLSSENITLPTNPATPVINEIKSSYPMRVLVQEDEQLVSEDAGIVDGIGMNYQEGKDNVYYNVNGMRIANPSKGIYIVNGRKVVLK